MSVGLFIDHVDAVPASVGDGVAEPERHDDDGDDPQEVGGQPDQAEQQRGAQDAGDDGVWSSLLAEYPAESFVRRCRAWRVPSGPAIPLR
jgi:hypothetical protein